MPLSRLAVILAVSLGLATTTGLAACGRNASFDDKVHAYLLAHPEVLLEMQAKLQAKADAQTAAKAKALVGANRAALEHDASDFVANPTGKVTVVEFYDYRCPHCANMAPDVLALIAAHPDVRFVFKEFPIFGDTSDRAAEGALALKDKGGDYLGLYKDLMSQHGLDDAGLDQILKAHGLDPKTLDDPTVQAREKAHLATVKQLADAIGVDGTPTFIIGDVVIPGEDPDALKAAIDAALKKAG